jgi:spore maturation protein CgeB
MTFIDIKTQLNDFFDDDEVVFYKNIDDLSEKLNYFRENDSSRKKIARKGQEKYFRYFNSNLIANYIIEKTFNFKSKQHYLWE